MEWVKVCVIHGDMEWGQVCMIHGDMEWGQGDNGMGMGH